MRAGRDWVKRNLGFDPKEEPPPAATFAFIAKPAKAKPEDFQREIIDFDSESPAGLQFMAFSTATGLSRFTDISWPAGLDPKTGPKPKGGAAKLPKADVLVVTWTVDEGHALSRVLTPGKDSRNDYVPYTRNYAAIAKKMRAGCPALQAKNLGTYWTTKIGKKSVVVFKSSSHMSQDGPQLPNIDVWRQIIEDVRPSLVITTGTAGGIGADVEVGDVVVSPIVHFDCTKKFKNKVVDGNKIAQAVYTSQKADRKYFAAAKKLFKANAGQLPPDNTRPPKILVVPPTLPGELKHSVVTTDFFGFDTSANTYDLKNLGYVCEMGDAVLGLVSSEMGADAPRWLAIRNVSDPQIKSEGTLKDQAHVAATIYKGFGRWSTVCSALVCWAAILAAP